MNPTSAWRVRVWLAAALILTGFKIWLTRGQGLYAIGGAAQDDRLLVELARHVVDGNWLGSYSELTLTQRPFYPLFIAAAFGLGLPLFLAQQIFYAAACAFFVRALSPAVAPGGRCAIYALLLWNPMTFDAPQMGRVSFVQVQGPLVLMIIAGCGALYVRRHEPWRRQAWWAMLLGLAWAAFYLTGPGLAWLAAAVILLGLAALHGARKISRAALRRTGGLLTAAMAIAVLPVLFVMTQNKRHYDRFVTSEPAASSPAQTPRVKPFAAADFLLRFSRFSARPQPSTGTPDELNLFRDLTGERLSPPVGELDVVGGAEYVQNLGKVERLHAIGKVLRPFLLTLGVFAHVLLLVRILQIARYRQWTYPFTLALAAWIAGAVALALPVGPGELSIAAFAPLYPLLLVFISTIFWDAVTAWYPRSNSTGNGTAALSG